MTERTTVVIVGAGTCGLAAACELAQLGVPVRIFESQPGPSQGARATLLWPPGLALLRDLGTYEAAQREGLRLTALQYRLDGGTTLRTTVGAENEALVLAQDKTSAILERRFEELGGKIERSTPVTKVASSAGGVTVTTARPSGTEVVEADWLIAADGVGSTVREQLGIDFPGVTLPMSYLGAEGHIEGDLKPGVIHYYLRAAGPLVIAPLRGGMVRLGTPVPDGTDLTAATVQRLLDERAGAGFRITSLESVISFSCQERIAAKFRVDRCFLVGDAAHTHSPIGGQGLNLGLQDVHNLAWKLAGVVHGQFDAAILNSYEPERRWAAEQTVLNTRRFSRMFLLGPVQSRLRNAVWRGLEATGVLRRRFLPLLAGWLLVYPDVLSGPAGLPKEPDRGGSRLPQAGSRSGHWVSAATRPGTFLLLSTGRADSQLGQEAQRLAAARPALVEYVRHRDGTDGFELIRPDGFVARSGRTSGELDQAATLLASITAPADRQ